MMEKMVWFITSAGRGLGVGTRRDEPSHIHIPRPSRVRRPDHTGEGATRGARGDAGHRASPAGSESRS